MSVIKYRSLKLLYVVMALSITTSCGVKTGIHNLNNYHHPLYIDEEPLRYWEAETYSPRFFGDKMDILLGIGCNSGKEEGKIVVDGWWWPEIQTYLWDVHLGTRFFPLGIRNQRIVPYVGGGVGYFEYDMDTNRPSEDDYHYSDYYYDHYGIDKHHDTIAHGYFPYLSMGLYLPHKKRYMLQLEFRYDFDKTYKQYDMGGYLITVGFAFMH